MEKIINIEKTDSKFKNYTLFDIETTGLNRKKDFMYMFGICKKEDDKLIYIQYYIEDEKDEKELILKLNEILKNETVISYNGDRFDFPFVRKRAINYNIEIENFKNVKNIDIYREFQKLNLFLNEKSLKAINLGKRLGLNVHDHVNNTELPKIFKMYQDVKDKNLLAKLIYHNYIDLKVLSKIYEYKISILDSILTINNKKFKGIIKNLYIQKNFLVIRLLNLDNKNINFSEFNYEIKTNKDEIKIMLEIKSLVLKNEDKLIIFKLSKYENKIFKYSSFLKENYVLLFKNNILIKENLLLLLNLI